MTKYISALRKMEKWQKHEIAKRVHSAMMINKNVYKHYHGEKVGKISGFLIALKMFGVITEDERFAVYHRARIAIRKWGR